MGEKITFAGGITSAIHVSNWLRKYHNSQCVYDMASDTIGITTPGGVVIVSAGEVIELPTGREQK